MKTFYNLMDKHSKPIIILIAILLTLFAVLAVCFPTWAASGDSTWVGATGENLLYALVTDGTYLYAGGSKEYMVSPAWMAKISLATLETVAVWTGGAGQTNAVNALYLDGYVYMCLQNGIINEPSQVVKIRVSDMTLAGTWTDPDGIMNLAGIVTDGTYLYVGREQQTAKVRKLNPSDMSLVLTWVSDGGAALRAFTLAYDGAYIYVGCDNPPAMVIKINPINMGTVAIWTGATGQDFCEGVMTDNVSVYAILRTDWNATLPYQVVKIDKRTMATVASIKGTDNQTTGGEGFNLIAGYLYVPIHPKDPGQLVIIDSNNMTPIQTWTAQNGQHSLLTTYFDGTYLYAGFWTSPGQVVKIKMIGNPLLPEMTPPVVPYKPPPYIPLPPVPQFVDDGGSGGGGGGGVSGDKRFTSILGLQGQDMKVTEDIEALSVDINVSLLIKQGTQVKNNIGQRVNTITIEKLPDTSTAYPKVGIIGDIYDMRLTGNTFKPSAILTISYDLPKDIDPQSLILVCWESDKKEWQELPSSKVDLKTSKVSALIDHLSTYALKQRTVVFPKWTAAQFAEEYGISQNETMRLVTLVKAKPDDGEITTMSSIDKSALLWLAQYLE